MLRLLAVLVGFAAALGVATPVQADASPWRWQLPVVCVDDHSTGGWPVAQAVESIDASTRWVSVVRDAGCVGHSQVVTVVDGDWPDEQLTAQAKLRCTGDVACGDGDRWLQHVWLRINAHHMRAYEPDEQVLILQHELLHALGVAHTEHTDSIMGAPEDALRFSAPTAYDVGEVTRMYRRGVDFRPAWRYLMPA